MATVRRGIHRQLEDEADRLIKESLDGVTKHSDKADILTPWKQQARYAREIYVTTGTPDRAIRLGFFHRVTNPDRPELNSREGVARPRDLARNLSDFVDMNHIGEADDH